MFLDLNRTSSLKIKLKNLVICVALHTIVNTLDNSLSVTLGALASKPNAFKPVSLL